MKERTSVLLASVLLIGLVLACKKSSSSSPSPASSTTAVATAAPTAPATRTTTGGTGDLASAQTLLNKFLDPSADTKALTQSLKPSSADYVTVFGSSSAKAETYYAKMWSDPSAVVAPTSGQTELILFSDSTDKVVTSPGKFPGGYSKAKLQPGLTVYGWKFVEPGKTLGMAFDGLIFVNGHFAFFPKPWRATE